MIDVSPDAIQSVQQLATAWRAVVVDHGPGDVRDLPGMAIRWADSKFAFWNCITLNDVGADSRLLDERLAQAVAYMRQKSQPGLIWLFEDLLDPSARAGLPAAADRAGLSLSLSTQPPAKNQTGVNGQQLYASSLGGCPTPIA